MLADNSNHHFYEDVLLLHMEQITDDNCELIFHFSSLSILGLYLIAGLLSMFMIVTISE
jgi:hypothetical protein